MKISHKSPVAIFFFTICIVYFLINTIYVCLNVRSKAMDDNEFYMILPSTSSLDVYPYNNASHYTVALQNPITLHGKWEIGVLEVNLPYPKYNLSPEDGIRYMAVDEAAEHGPSYRQELDFQKLGTNYYRPRLVGTNWSFYDDERHVTYEKLLSYHTQESVNTYKLTLWSYSEFKIYFDVIDDSKKMGFVALEIPSWMINVEKHSPLWIIETNSFTITEEDLISFRVYFTPKVNPLEIEKYIYIGEYKVVEDLQHLIGIISSYFHDIVYKLHAMNNKKLVFEFRGKLREIEFLGNLAQILGCRKSKYRIHEDRIPSFTHIFNPEDMPVLKSILLPQVYIHTNISEPVRIGEKDLSIVASIYFSGIHQKLGHGETITYTIHEPMYIPVTQTTLSSIDIVVKSPNGFIVPVIVGKSMSILVHLRRKH